MAGKSGIFKISSKLFISSLVFSLPIAALLFFLVNGFNNDIRFSTLEIYGNEYQRPLEKILEYLPEFKMGKLNQEQGRVSNAVGKIDEAFRDLESVDKKIGEDLQFTEEGLAKRSRGHLRVPIVKAKWDSLKTASVLEGYDSMVGDIREMVTHGGDTSNLILDPDLDSYYIMDVTLLALPDTQVRLGDVLEYGRELLNKGGLTEKQRRQLYVYAAGLEGDMERVQGSISTSFNEDQNFYGLSPTLEPSISPALDAYVSANTKFVNMVRSIADLPAGGTGFGEEQFVNAGLELNKAISRMWDASVKELDVLLEKRVDDYRSARMLALVVTGAALAVAILLVIMIGRSIIVPVGRIQQYTRGVAQGDLDVSMEGVFSGELAALSGDVQVMVNELKRQMSQLAKADELEAETQRALEAIAEAESAKQKSERVEAYQKNEIVKLNAVLSELAQGNLTVQYTAGEADEEAKEAQSGFLELERALNDTIVNLAKIINKIKGDASVLSDSADQLSGVSTQLLQGSEDMSLQSGNVAGATEQMSMNINSMASAAEEMSVNVSTVSSTAEEMAQTMTSVAASIEGVRKAIANIADNAGEGSKVAAKAMNMAQEATSTMTQLGAAAREIGKVTEVIKRIAEQTNLLALNATIEAASAGEAGKGFAVVAHEIKELANQSAKAAEDIASKIEGVQGNTVEAVRVIDEVASIINNINDAVSVITDSVEEQTKAANEIALNVSETTKGVDDIAISISELANGANDMSQNAGEVAKGTNDVAANILGVSRSAESGSHGAKEVNNLARGLAEVAGELENIVSTFRAEETEE